MQSANSITHMQDKELPSEEQDEFVKLWNALMIELRYKLKNFNNLNAELNEILPQEFSLSVGDGLLSVWLNPYTGLGSWNCISQKLNMAEPWQAISPDEIQLDGETMNLTATAERFIAKVSGQWTVPVLAR